MGSGPTSFEQHRGSAYVDIQKELEELKGFDDIF